MAAAGSGATLNNYLHKLIHGRRKAEKAPFLSRLRCVMTAKPWKGHDGLFFLFFYFVGLLGCLLLAHKAESLSADAEQEIQKQTNMANKSESARKK